MNQEAFWDAETTTDLPRVRDMTIGPATTDDAREFCARYHYTGVGNNINWRWGLWHGVTLYGVVAYNLPTRDVCESVFGDEHFDKVWHMGRLVMADSSPRNSESRLIGGSLKAIERRGDVWAVLTYAATDVGHIGYVYQATNAIYTGTAGDPYCFIDRDGNRRGTHLDGSRVDVERARGMGWTRMRGGPKHRYLYLLGSKTERRQRRALLKLPVLPYPKATEAAA